MSAATKAKIAKAQRGNKNAYKGGPRPKTSSGSKLEAKRFSKSHIDPYKRGQFKANRSRTAAALAKVGIKTKRYKADQRRAKLAFDAQVRRGVKSLIKMEQGTYGKRRR